jgi:hypothetical protein
MLQVLFCSCLLNKKKSSHFLSLTSQLLDWTLDPPLGAAGKKRKTLDSTDIKKNNKKLIKQLTQAKNNVLSQVFLKYQTRHICKH